MKINSITRRSFVGAAAAMTLVGATAPAKAFPIRPQSAPADTFLDLLRSPDSVIAYSELKYPLRLDRQGEHWTGAGLEVLTSAASHELKITVTAPRIALQYVHLRWSLPVDENIHVLGDAWERSYGDLSWRNLTAERVLPWYFAAISDRYCCCYGVKTGARALCFWQMDATGISLWLDLRNGGSGVELGQRALLAATVVTLRNPGHETLQDTIHEFCRQMCSLPPLPFLPVYGTNDWYYAYGKNSAQQILEDTEFISSLSTSNKVRPFSVIDDGWSIGAPAYPDMARLASDIRARNVRPGIWIRPLIAPPQTKPNLLLADARFGERTSRAKDLAYDPTIPEALDLAIAKIRQLSSWNYDLIKHDYSTYDLFGQWGFEMGASPTLDGWSLNDRSRTNAEVLLDFYARIRDACGPNRLILGCNTVGHLAQGLFDIQRTGDDTSGQSWERTRRTGINTLAYRLPQHKAFFIQDADCVGISAAVPWDKNQQWLDLLAKSGTALFISPGEGARTTQHAALIRDAFQLAASGNSSARPLNWESTPEDWSVNGEQRKYDWYSPEGAYPFTV